MATLSDNQIATPCPAPPPQSLSNLPVPIGGRRQSYSIISDDTATIDIEYTQAITNHLRASRPRRKSTFHSNNRQQQQRQLNAISSVTIFEDVCENQGAAAVVAEPKPEFQGNTLLGKPARKIATKSLQSVPETSSLNNAHPLPLNRVGQARRRSSLMPQVEESRSAASTIELGRVEERAQNVLKKDPRRRTIFVPSDDTTILTIHPGANATERINDTFQIPHQITNHLLMKDFDDGDVDNNKSQARRGPRISIAGAPKRFPLQQKPTVENNLPLWDIPGQNGGKENIPPQSIVSTDKGKDIQEQHSYLEIPDMRRSSIFPKPNAPLVARRPAEQSRAVARSRYSLTTGGSYTISNTMESKHRQAELTTAQARLGNGQQPLSSEYNIIKTGNVKPLQNTTRQAPRRISPTGKLRHYPVLTEDLYHPELYEDNWLSQQEVSLTEVINQIFRNSEPSRRLEDESKRSLRERSIGTYHQPQVAIIHRRLQASLTYGALSKPKGTFELPSPSTDIGLRKRFLALWLNSYREDELRAAAEVVFGRQISRKQLSRSAHDIGAIEDSIDACRSRRELTSFLETFLVDCYDVEHLEDTDDSRVEPFSVQKWRKMVLRSLMLIWLLDQPKSSAAVDRCLFLTSSPRKTSQSMLDALSTVLIPWVGDFKRVLRHLEYEVSYTQNALQEVKYHIGNIAVDLRDGIFLTRLVEILLFGLNCARRLQLDGNATVTIQMPEFEILESVIQDGSCADSRVLSQHLKIPCSSRAQKIYNVQLALSALHDYGKAEDHLAQDINAEHIVDGYREKTLSFLWSLVSIYGLNELVDWDELMADVKRITAQNRSLSNGLENQRGFEQVDIDLSKRESLLQTWASAHCATKGLRISNLTTSFADGMAYSAIVTSFIAYTGVKISSGGEDIEKHLRALGCSTGFISQIVCSTHTIPSRKATLSTLVFLASRLLPLARDFNAAVRIQHAFRARQRRISISRRIALMRLAHACAIVVTTQERIVHAAIVLQRSWRSVVDSRITNWNRDVTAVQSLARGWLARKKAVPTWKGCCGPYSLEVLNKWS